MHACAHKITNFCAYCLKCCPRLPLPPQGRYNYDMHNFPEPMFIHDVSNDKWIGNDQSQDKLRSLNYFPSHVLIWMHFRTAACCAHSKNFPMCDLSNQLYYLLESQTKLPHFNIVRIQSAFLLRGKKIFFDGHGYCLIKICSSVCSWP